MRLEPPLKELNGSCRLALGFFNSLINRIECTKPIAGSGISIVQQADGIVINGGISNAITYLLNVCSNGTPGTIVVYGAKS